MLISDYHVIGNRLLAFRKRIGMTQAEVAEAADLSDRTYADIERGAANMRLETLMRICRVLHITPDELLTEEPADLSAREDEVLGRLRTYSQKVQKSTYDLIEIYLNSLD